MSLLPITSLVPEFLLDVRRDAGVVVVSLVGDLSLETERGLAAGLRRGVAISDIAFVLDLVRLEQLAPGGVDVLTRFVHDIGRRGVAVAVVGLTPVQSRLWLGTGRPIPTQYASTRDAVIALGRPRPSETRRAAEPLSVQQLEQEVLDMRLAMLTRATIEQAKGRLMERLRCSADEAFAVLADQSQRSNRKLVAIASEVIAEGNI